MVWYVSRMFFFCLADPSFFAICILVLSCCLFSLRSLILLLFLLSLLLLLLCVFSVMSSGVGVFEAEEEVEADVSCGTKAGLSSGSSIGRRYQEVSRSITEEDAARKEEAAEDDKEGFCEIDGEEVVGACKLHVEEEDEEEEDEEEEDEEEEDEDEEEEEEDDEGTAAGVGSSEMTQPRLSRRGVGRKW